MRSLVILPLAFILGCGGSAQKPCPAAPVAQTAPTTVEPPAKEAPPPPASAKSVAETPAPFTGSFDVTTMSDGKTTASTAEFVKKGGAVDGRMTWELGKDSFGVGFWQVASPMHDSQDPAEVLSAFCRAKGTVSAHWEGMTLVLASTISADGAGEAIRTRTTSDGAKTTRRTATKQASCAASFKALRIAFEILDKDDTGPTRLKAKAEDGTFELVRGKPDSAIEPKEILKAAR